MRFVLSLYAVCCMLSTACIAQYLEATIRVNLRPDDVLWTPTSNKVYVSSPYDENVVIIDAATLQLRTALEMGDQPNEMCWNSVNNKVYVALTTDQIAVIDGTTNQVLNTISVPEPYNLAVNTISNKVYSTSSDLDLLTVVCSAGDSVITTLNLPGYPGLMAFNPTMNHLYVASHEAGVIRILDGARDSLVKSVRVGAAMFDNMHLLWHPHTNRLFCALWSGRAEVVIDCVSEEIVHTVWAQGPRAMCWNRVNDYVYALAGDTVYAFTAAGDSIAAKTPLLIGYYGEAACFVPYPNKVYAFGTGPGRTYVLDCDANEVTDTLIGGGADLLLDSIAGKVYVAGGGTRVYDARSDTELTRFYASGPMAWNPGERRVYIASYAGFVCVLRDTATGVEEGAQPPAPSIEHGASIVRGTLWLSPASSLKPQASSLLDIGGREVMKLHVGRNDVRALAPGVYFMRLDAKGRATKIVITR